MSKQGAGKVALITGANKGLGFETARQLAQLGYTILLGARNAGRGTEAAAKLKAENLDVQFLELDVDNPASRESARRFIEEKFGKLDVLINNAAVNFEMGSGGLQTTSQLSLDTYRKTFETNFFNTIALTQELLPLVRKSDAGRIVNLSSILGSTTFHATPGSPIYDFKVPAYNISKAALNSFTVHLAYELKDTPIKINAAHPGWVKTDMGGEEAPMEIVDGVKTSVALATLKADGPNGRFIHLGDELPW
jgi:NAD(P)-dependent dehydrogenase (short-subunit alcohol dehydrogenase family)